MSFTAQKVFNFNRQTFKKHRAEPFRHGTSTAYPCGFRGNAEFAFATAGSSRTDDDRLNAESKPTNRYTLFPVTAPTQTKLIRKQKAYNECTELPISEQQQKQVLKQYYT